jgi:hypothetical protein
VSISYHEAAVSMLQRAEHDMLALYDANDTSPDPAYRKYSSNGAFLDVRRMQVGLGSYTVRNGRPQGVFNEAFYESIVKAIISSIKQTFSG